MLGHWLPYKRTVLFWHCQGRPRYCALRSARRRSATRTVYQTNNDTLEVDYWWVIYSLAVNARRKSSTLMRYLNALRPSMKITGTSSLYFCRNSGSASMSTSRH